MSSYHLSSKADGDIDDIVDYTFETWGESQTHNYVTEIYLFLQTLADNPELGRSASEFVAPLKRYNYKAHTIFYEPTRKGILVVLFKVFVSTMSFSNFNFGNPLKRSILIYPLELLFNKRGM